MPASGRAGSSASLANDAAEKAPSAMATHKYRQPLIGQAFVDLVEGQHPRGLALDAYAGRYLLICCFGSAQIDPGRAALAALREHAGLFEDETKSFRQCAPLADARRRKYVLLEVADSQLSFPCSIRWHCCANGHCQSVNGVTTTRSGQIQRGNL